MIIVDLLNLKTNKRFEKTFYNETSYKKFMNKLKYSKKLMWLGTTYY